MSMLLKDSLEIPVRLKTIFDENLQFYYTLNLYFLKKNINKIQIQV